MKGRPGASLPAADFQAMRKLLAQQRGKAEEDISDREVVTHLLYPRVFADFVDHQAKYGDTSILPTPVFFHGMEPGRGDQRRHRGGQDADHQVPDGRRSAPRWPAAGLLRTERPAARGPGGRPFAGRGEVQRHPKAESGNPLHVGAPMPGLVVRVNVAAGDQVAAGQKLVTLEAMKMETTVYADRPARIAEVLVRPGEQVEAGDLLLRLELNG